MSVFERWKFIREIRRRKSAERHLQEGGCILCDGDQYEYLRRTNPLAYIEMKMMAEFGLIYGLKMCPVDRKAKSVEDVLSEIK